MNVYFKPNSKHYLYVTKGDWIEEYCITKNHISRTVCENEEIMPNKPNKNLLTMYNNPGINSDIWYLHLETGIFYKEEHIDLNKHKVNRKEFWYNPKIGLVFDIYTKKHRLEPPSEVCFGGKNYLGTYPEWIKPPKKSKTIFIPTTWDYEDLLT